jgi:hypothetical protein
MPGAPIFRPRPEGAAHALRRERQFAQAHARQGRNGVADRAGDYRHAVLAGAPVGGLSVDTTLYLDVGHSRLDRAFTAELLRPPLREAFVPSPRRRARGNSALHTAAFWLTRCVRSAIPQTNPLARCKHLVRAPFFCGVPH